jgi:hypothetical protein
MFNKLFLKMNEFLSFVCFGLRFWNWELELAIGIEMECGFGFSSFPELECWRPVSVSYSSTHTRAFLY